MANTPKWLNDAVFYNIYPQSFLDSNGDGIGDLQGITDKLDYIKDTGFTAIWLNPVYVSPFRDAGYDITDFYKVAPRYGTNEDFRHLCDEAHKRGIRVVMDLVAGHTSLECEWFKKSALPEKNEYSDRYVWTDSVWKMGTEGSFISGYSDRDGCYMNNFFYCQPALNYGYKNITEPWQMSMNSPAAIDTRNELLNIMSFWSDLGSDGFRVDMASSLVKGDPDKSGVIELWNIIKKEFTAKYPENILIAEWSFPKEAIAAGFDIDFLIHFNLKAYTTLFRHEKGTNQSEAWIGHSYFRKDGKGDIDLFLNEYLDHYNATKGKGFISIPTGNHDIHRISLLRDTDDLFVTHAFLLTMPGVPFVYYGDEIGMKYIEGLASKEGGFNRTGSRTPMQWESGKNLGFSASDTPYLPVDTSSDAPTVAAQSKDGNSLLNHTKKLIRIRKENPALWANGEFEVVHKNYPFVYKRTGGSQTIIVAVNPANRRAEISAPACRKVIYAKDAQADGTTLKMDGVSFIIYEA